MAPLPGAVTSDASQTWALPPRGLHSVRPLCLSFLIGKMETVAVSHRVPGRTTRVSAHKALKVASGPELARNQRCLKEEARGPASPARAGDRGPWTVDRGRRSGSRRRALVLTVLQCAAQRYARLVHARRTRPTRPERLDEGDGKTRKRDVTTRDATTRHSSPCCSFRERPVCSGSRPAPTRDSERDAARTPHGLQGSPRLCVSPASLQNHAPLWPGPPPWS